MYVIYMYLISLQHSIPILNIVLPFNFYYECVYHNTICVCAENEEFWGKRLSRATENTWNSSFTTVQIEDCFWHLDCVCVREQC